MALSEIILPPGSTSTDLQTAVDNADLGDTIVISGDMLFTDTVTILSGKEITIQSDPGNNWVMSSPGDNLRHFIVDGSLVLQNITIDGGEVGGGIQSNGTLTMNTGAVIQNCNCADIGRGGAVYAAGTSSKFYMYDGVINNNKCSYGAGVALDYGANFVMGDASGTKNPVISGNAATIHGGGITVFPGSTFIMESGTISGNNANSTGGGVYNDGTFTMNGGTISGNTAAAYGGGVMNIRTFTVTGGTIGGNKSSGLYGGGIYTTQAISISNATISGNSATLGGGIYSTAAITINDSVIGGASASYANTATIGNGGGICCFGTLTITDSKVDYNTATAGNGGGIYSTGILTMTGSTISNNTSYSTGGGVYSGGTFNMESGEISGNAAVSGGGIYVVSSGTLNITGTVGIPYITDNTASGNGGGIYTENTAYSNLTTAESTVFIGNTAATPYKPPADATTMFPNIGFSSVSIFTHPLNNFDINYEAFFNVNYNANGGIGSYMGPDTVPGDTDTVLGIVDTGISYPGHTFTGWNTEPDGSGISYAPGDTITLDSDVTLYAQWTDEREYTVIYNANGGNGSHTDSGRQYDTNYTILLPIQTGITRPGYTFTGWNTEPDGSGISFAPGDIITITGDLTLYAQWRQDSVTKPKRICPKPVTKCRTAIEGQKIWVDDDNIGNTRPDTIEIILLRDGEVYKTTNVNLENDWAFGFCCLPVWKNSGHKYVYKIDETAVSGYTTTIEGYNVTNTLTP